MSGKNLSLKLWPKMLLADQISVLSSCQNLMNGLISNFDFLNVDGYEWKEQGLWMVLLKKILF